MSLISILSKGIQAMITEATTPESFRIGRNFEEYARQFLFPANYYDLVEQSHSYEVNRKDYVESSLKPDYTFRDKWTKKEFFVECKFRTGLYQNKLAWCNENQLVRYREYTQQRPVFVLFGLGEDANYPEFLSLMPLSRIQYTALYPSVVEKFAVDLDQPVSSKLLWSR